MAGSKVNWANPEELAEKNTPKPIKAMRAKGRLKTNRNPQDLDFMAQGVS